MTFYTNLRSVANGLLIDKGQRVTLIKTTTGAYDPATGAAAVTTSNYANIPAAVFGFKNMEIDGTLILKGDKKVIMSAESLAVTPGKDDIISVGGVYHSILNVEEINPAGTPVIYKLQCRRT